MEPGACEIGAVSVVVIPEIRVICSADVPDSWHVMCDAQKKTRAIVMLAPVFRVIYGNPADEAITELRISVLAMARHAISAAHLAALEMWEPEGRPQ